jgi:metallo-beta-lactamase family protein
MKLTFYGAAKQVTGSMHLITLESGFQVLIDCGLDYENRMDFDANNRNFPFLPETIDLLILTHAHIDHSGNIPNLVRQGFCGAIICSEPTVELSHNLLNDSLNVQLIEGRKSKGKKNHKKSFKKQDQVPTLYQKAHIEQSVSAMLGLGFNQPYKVNDELTIELFEAGHILGAASVKLSINENNETKYMGFTGDLGNYGSKLMKDPTPMKGLDYLITESTYGGRLHTQDKIAEDVLLNYIKNTCEKFGGKLVIPAFSVGRTQAILFTLKQLYTKGLLPPKVKIYTDSPLAIKTSRMYEKFKKYLNDEAQFFINQHGDLFGFENLYVIENSKDSELMSLLPEPAVIVSAAGMVEGGRIQDHIRNHISDAYSTILIAGFCAEGTFGHELLMGKPTVRINFKEKDVHAQIARTDVFSAHPDQNGLLRYLNEVDFKSIKKIFLVHGDLSSMTKFKETIPHPSVFMPDFEESFNL